MNPLLRKYLLAIGAMSLAIVVRMQLDPILGDRLPFIWQFAAVAFSARYCGRNPTLLIIALGSCAVAFFHLTPQHSFAIEQPEYQIGIAMYAVVGIGIALLFESLEKNKLAAETSARDALKQKELLTQEVAVRRGAETALAAQREWLQTTLSSVGDGVIATDVAGRVTFLNPVAQALTGWTLDEATGRPLSEVFKIINEASREAVPNPALRALSEGLVVGLANHTILISKDGTEYPIDDSAAPIRNAAGQIGGAILVFRDITDRKRSDEALTQSLARESQRSERLRQVSAAALTLNSATSSASVLGIIEAEAQRILNTDQATVDLQGDASMPPATGPVAAEPLPPAKELMAELLGRGGQRLGQIRLAAKKAEGFTDDDQAILTQIAQMGAVALDNARLHEELREKDRRKDEFLAMLAHELRNPLAPIRNAIELLQHDNDKATTELAQGIIQRQVEHIVRLVDDLLDVSRVMQGKIQLRRGIIELSSAMHHAIEEVKPAIEARQQHLRLSLSSEPIWVDADSIRLSQIISNLLANAAKFTDQGGKIMLDVKSQGNQVAIAVSDEGMGIAPDMLEQIFDPFTQVVSSLDRSHGGLGIGLALVRRLTQLHGGSVRATSAGLGKGSQFTVTLPVVSQHLAALPQDTTPVPLAASRVLVVDDNRSAAETLGLLLAKLWNHEVQLAFDGITAVEMAEQFKPDVVLLDIGLPGLSGYEVARRLRQSPEQSKVLLVALTGYGQEQDQRRSREAGFDNHLVKPVSVPSLQAVFEQRRREF